MRTPQRFQATDAHFRHASWSDRRQTLPNSGKKSSGPKALPPPARPSVEAEAREKAIAEGIRARAEKTQAQILEANHLALNALHDLVDLDDNQQLKDLVSEHLAAIKLLTARIRARRAGLPVRPYRAVGAPGASGAEARRDPYPPPPLQ